MHKRGRAGHGERRVEQRDGCGQRFGRQNELLERGPADLQYAAKEASRHMAKPRDEDASRVQRVAKYLYKEGQRRMEQAFCWQPECGTIDVFTVSDWGGCRTSLQSTSGGLVKAFGHVVKSWCTTQKHISLSSAEAELYAANKGAAEGLGVVAAARDFGDRVFLNLHTDASAAIGIASRRGLGRLRHIDVQDLWLQEKSHRGQIRLVKVSGLLFPADILTNHRWQRESTP